MPDIPADVNRLRLEYAPASYAAGIRYQFRLEPMSADWSPWSEEPFTEFTNLWEGRYVFRLRTQGYGGNFSPEAMYVFRVLPPWYRTIYAYTGYALILFLGVAAVSRLRNRALRRRTLRLQEQVAQQTRELARMVEELKGAKGEVEDKNLQLEEANRRLKTLSMRDGLTGIANRRQLEETLQREWARAWRMDTPLAVILIDIDFFKKLNDSLGHLEGDDCLRRVAGFLEKSLRRSGDMAARYGGDEFLLILPGTGPGGASHFAGKIAAGILELGIPFPASFFGIVTTSIGVAIRFPRKGGTVAELLADADRALYRAKSAGRNRVCYAEATGEALIDPELGD
jgi:diguanylate cyclase (GGDEF)-like protein